MNLRKITKILLGVAAVAAIGLGAQAATAGGSEGVTVPLRATWAYQPHSLTEARDTAQTIVLADVVGIQRGPDIVTAQPGEPDGVDRVPTQRVTLRVVTSYKGAVRAGEQLTLFQTGGTVNGKPNLRMELVGDPAYNRGEQYLLMLVPGPDGTVRAISPEGRYRHDKATGALTPMVDGSVGSEVRARKLTDWEQTLTAHN
ncbi:hypothetical protein R8Z50_10875 [Longispora sp. K20-0274]|uniref:hypothetical protein n=1 Tax=Longispora sp. K20-0274 TaxID=3088255 RepID=UPI00399B861C